MSNPLESLENAAKTAVRNTMGWAMGSRRWVDPNQKGKTDTVFAKQPMDVLRRAACNNVFESLFAHSIDSFPYVVPDKTLKKVIGRMAFSMFPRQTVFLCEDEASNNLLVDFIEKTLFDLKTENIVEEAAMMGFCGLRTVWVDELKKWILEVKPKEYLVIEAYPGVPGEVLAIGLEWPVERKENGKTRTYWKKERWTNEEYQVWAEKSETLDGQKPTFKPEEAITEPNNYGEIPYTIVPHIYDAARHGVGIIGEEEILAAKALIRLRHKRHFAHLKYMDPNPVRKNHADPGEPLDLGIGQVIDLQQVDENMPVALELMEFSGIPESVKDEIYDHTKAIYEAAGFKAPPPEEVFKVGSQSSGVALRIRDKDDADTIQTLRDGGYSNVLRHFEKVLRMGARLNLPEYSVINPEDPKTWTVTAIFPDFFAPTDEEIAVKLANMRTAELPADITGPMVAALFGIEDPEQIEAVTEKRRQHETAFSPGALNARDTDPGEQE